MNILRALWNDERGITLSAELVLIATIVVIGLIVGLTAYRDGLVQEFGDMAWGVGSLDQSYSYATTLPTMPLTFGNAPDQVTVTVSVGNSSFTDLNDDCDAAVEGAGTQSNPGGANFASGCIVIGTTAVAGEGDTAQPSN